MLINDKFSIKIFNIDDSYDEIKTKKYYLTFHGRKTYEMDICNIRYLYVANTDQYKNHYIAMDFANYCLKSC